MLFRTVLVLTAISLNALAQPRAAEVLPGRYLVEFEGEPLATFQQSINKTGRARAAEMIRDHRTALRSRHDSARAMLASRGITVRGTIETVGNAIAVEGATIEQLRDLPGVKRIVPVRRMHVYMDRVAEILQLGQAWDQVGGVNNAGAGLKIAIIDTGIDETHQAFRDPALTAPEGYPKLSSEVNRPFVSGKIIAARSYEGTVRDCEGHGTGVAMAAAGVQHQAGSRTLSGIAPKAWLGIYRASDSCEGSFPTDNVELAIEDAVKDGMDIINLSLGGPGIEALETDEFQPYLDRAIAAGVMVVSAAGNEGPESGTLSDTGSGKAIAVGSTATTTRTGAGIAIGNDSIIGSPGSNSSDASPVEGKAKDIGTFDSSRLGCDPYPADAGVTGRIALVSRGDCAFLLKYNNAAAAGAVGIVVYNNEDSLELVTMEATGATIPGLFVSKLDGEKLRALLGADPEIDVRLVFAASLPDDPNRVPGYSSRGPTADLAIKPDVVATGTVRTAFPSSLAPPNSYAIFTGTSFASPIVAGAAALLKQKRPGLSISQYHSLLTNTATAVPSPVMTAGAGRLNINAALTNNLVSAPVSVSFGRFLEAKTATREFAVTNIGTGSEIYNARVSSENGLQPILSQTDFSLAPGASQQLMLRFDEPAPGAGSYQGFVEITGSNGSSIRIPYWMGVRGTEPSQITIAYPVADGAPGGRVFIFFRLVDDSLVPFEDGNPDIESVSGGGTISSVQYGGRLYPGTFIATVRLGRLPGTNVFRIKAGKLEREIRVRGSN